MYVDAELQFSDSQAVTAAAASTNIIDLGSVRDLGAGQDLYLVVNCTVAMTDGSSDSTLAVTLQTDDNSGFSSATTGQTIGTFAATSAVGTQMISKVDVGALNERYARVYYTPANGNLTTGSFDAFLTTDVDKYTAYADNITIS